MTISLFPETIQYELKHPTTKEPTGFILELVGQEHDDVYQAQLDTFKSLKIKGAKETSDFVMALETRISISLACIVGWTNTSEEFKQVFVKLGFKDDTYSKDKAKALVSMKTASWIRAQIEEAVGDRNSFFKEASPV